MKRSSTCYLLLLLFALPLHGFTVRKGESIYISEDEIINDDILILARDINVRGTVNGDLYTFGQNITVSGPVKGTVLSGGMEINFKSPQLNTVWAGGAEINAAGKFDGNLIIMGGTLVLESDCQVRRDLRAYGGNLNVNGDIEGIIVAGVGDFNMTGRSRSIYLNAENVMIRSNARINGEVEIESKNEPVIEDKSVIAGRINIHKPEPDEEKTNAFFALVPFLAFLAGIFRLFMFLAKLLTGILLIVLAKNYVRRIMDSLKTKTWHCLGWGFVSLLVVPTVGFVLLLTLIGLPLAVFTFYVFSTFLYLASIMVALVLGELIMGLFKKKGEISLYLSLIIGHIVISLLCLIPILGFFFRIVILIFGTGMLMHGSWQCIRDSKEKGLI